MVTQVLDYENSPYMADAGIRVEPQPVTVPGRVLSPPQVVYGSESLVSVHYACKDVRRRARTLGRRARHVECRWQAALRSCKDQGLGRR
jgi:hypothetical protein